MQKNALPWTVFIALGISDEGEETHATHRDRLLPHGLQKVQLALFTPEEAGVNSGSDLMERCYGEAETAQKEVEVPARGCGCVPGCACAQHEESSSSLPD